MEGNNVRNQERGGLEIGLEGVRNGDLFTRARNDFQNVQGTLEKIKLDAEAHYSEFASHYFDYNPSFFYRIAAFLPIVGNTIRKNLENKVGNAAGIAVDKWSTEVEKLGEYASKYSAQCVKLDDVIDRLMEVDKQCADDYKAAKAEFEPLNEKYATLSEKYANLAIAQRNTGEGLELAREVKATYKALKTRERAMKKAARIAYNSFMMHKTIEPIRDFAEDMADKFLSEYDSEKQNSDVMKLVPLDVRKDRDALIALERAKAAGAAAAESISETMNYRGRIVDKTTQIITELSVPPVSRNALEAFSYEIQNARARDDVYTARKTTIGCRLLFGDQIP